MCWPLLILGRGKGAGTEMDNISTLLLAIVSISISGLLAIYIAFLRSLDAKISEMKIDLIEIKGLIQSTRRR